MLTLRATPTDVVLTDTSARRRCKKPRISCQGRSLVARCVRHTATTARAPSHSSNNSAPQVNGYSGGLDGALRSQGGGLRQGRSSQADRVEREALIHGMDTSKVPIYLRQGLQASLDSWDTLDVEDAAAPRVAKRRRLLAPAEVWAAIRREAEADAEAEPLLSSFLYASILSHDGFEHSLAFILSNRLQDSTLVATQLFEVFYGVLSKKQDVVAAAAADIQAVYERDPACESYCQALVYFKGYHAIQAQRIAHELWLAGRKVMACVLQSRMSEVFAVDIHPGACFGRGILLDHGTGVVIGETAVVGNNVSILQNVTLGGTGKDSGDRHPKVGDGVLIGASACILGNIVIGHGAQVAADSLVLRPVPPHTMVAGSPAQEIGMVADNPSETMEHWCASDDEECLGKARECEERKQTDTIHVQGRRQEDPPEVEYFI